MRGHAIVHQRGVRDRPEVPGTAQFARLGVRQRGAQQLDDAARRRAGARAVQQQDRHRQPRQHTQAPSGGEQRVEVAHDRGDARTH